MQGDRKSGECLVLGDSILSNVGSECPDMKVECFPGIRTEQLQRPREPIHRRYPCGYKRFKTNWKSLLCHG